MNASTLPRPAYVPAQGTCRMCGAPIGRGARFCDRCFDILVAHAPADAPDPEDPDP